MYRIGVSIIHAYCVVGILAQLEPALVTRRLPYSIGAVMSVHSRNAWERAKLCPSQSESRAQPHVPQSPFGLHSQWLKTSYSLQVCEAPNTFNSANALIHSSSRRGLVSSNLFSGWLFLLFYSQFWVHAFFPPVFLFFLKNLKAFGFILRTLSWINWSVCRFIYISF